MDVKETEEKMRKSINVFCCYARNDQPFLVKLKTHLAVLEREKYITLWADTDINAGAEWEEEIHRHLNTSQITLLLVSPDFMASDYCYSVEMQRALERHEKGETNVIPIILRPVDWKRKALGRLQGLPTDGRPVTTWNDQDDAFYKIGLGIRDAVKTWITKEEQFRKAEEAEQLEQAHIPLVTSLLPRPDAPGAAKPTKFSVLRFVLVSLAGLVILALAGSSVWSISHPTGVITEFPNPTRGNLNRITAGLDGNLWFTEGSADKIGRITTLSGNITEFFIPTSGSNPGGITMGPDGNLWFTEMYGDRIGRITSNGAITEFPVPTSGSTPYRITAGPDGNLWFTEADSNKIGRITPSGNITEFPLPTAKSDPDEIIAGPDDNLWFMERNSDRIGRITPRGNITEFLIPTSGSNPNGITKGPDGNLWFTESNSNKIGRITPNGGITEFSLSTSENYLDEIITGPDDNLWFAEANSNRIGRITPNGGITEFPPHTYRSRPDGITVGPDGNLWFTEESADKIGRITTGKC